MADAFTVGTWRTSSSVGTAPVPLKYTTGQAGEAQKANAPSSTAAKSGDFTLREIKELPGIRVQPEPGESCAEVRGLIGAKLADLDRRLKDIRRLSRALVKLETACRHRTNLRDCPASWSMHL